MRTRHSMTHTCLICTPGYVSAHYCHYHESGIMRKKYFIEFGQLQLDFIYLLWGEHKSEGQIKSFVVLS